MKKFLIIVLSLLFTNFIYAEENNLSKPAVAFYSDNNYNKTLDLLLQIPENERTAQDWLLLGNLFDEKGEKTNAIFMYQKAIGGDKKYYKAYYNLANLYLEQNKYNMAIDNYKKAISYNIHFHTSKSLIPIENKKRISKSKSKNNLYLKKNLY